VIPLSGWVTERFGSKRTWIASIALFAAGSALCATATSAGELIAFRVLQGFGGGMLLPVGFTLVAQSAGPRRVGRALALVGVPVLLGPIFGPIIGGLIVDSVAWQWIFVVNAPIAVVAIFAAARLLEPDSGRGDAGVLDWLGAALLCPGLAGIVFGLSETESHGGIGQPNAFGPILAGFALVALFAMHSLRVTRPLIDVRLFRSRGFRAAATVTFVLGASIQPTTAAAYALLDSSQVPAPPSRSTRCGRSAARSAPRCSPWSSSARAGRACRWPPPSAIPSCGRSRWRCWPSFPRSRSCAPSGSPSRRSHREGRARPRWKSDKPAWCLGASRTRWLALARAANGRWQ
jgi:MFS family permease